MLRIPEAQYRERLIFPMLKNPQKVGIVFSIAASPDAKSGGDEP